MPAPAPLDWHPWYRDKTWLRDWLEGPHPGPYRVPVPTPLPLWVTDTPAPMAELLPAMVILTKHRVRAPAPYVGAPFHYQWAVAVDGLGPAHRRRGADRLRPDRMTALDIAHRRRGFCGAHAAGAGR